FDVWRIVLRRKNIIFITTSIFVFAAVAFVLIKAPVYRVEAMLMVVSEANQPLSTSSLASQLSGLAMLSGARLGYSDLREEALATLRSREFLENFIDQERILPVLFPSKWDDERKQWDVDDPSEVPTLAAGYEAFKSNILEVIEDRNGVSVIIRIDTHSRDKAAEWANRLVRQVNDRLRQRSIAEAQKSIEYLNAELEKTSIVELQQAIYDLLEQQVQKVMLANVREEFAFRVVD
ncbi:hypothetical protein GWN49_04270, partial [Candidatus Bathyarchaeota archaeon]|nr:hypothetical protein [Phycisphaerae bacterium]NIP51647.1 hypothetical protein [Phycisphaerae bacterium]NIV44084.1 hypothetical protein [Candidatus Bathyarchaeota archaeon]NIX28219.1 hypothetical protein [Phycisphaerae bacterium]